MFRDAVIGDRFEVEVEDAFGNMITLLDPGAMRDERTGAMAVGEEGGVVSYPADPNYEVFIPAGAFPDTTLVQITPLNTEELDTFPGQDNPDFHDRFELMDAVRVDLFPPERVAARNFDISVPYPNAPADAAEAQYLAARVVSFRNNPDGTPHYELTVFDTGHYDPTTGRIITDPAVFPGLTIGGSWGIIRARECVGYVLGWASTGDYFGGNTSGWIGGGMLGLLPFPIDDTQALRFAIPIPCNRPVEVTLNGPDDEPIDEDCGCSEGPVPTGPIPISQAVPARWGRVRRKCSTARSAPRIRAPRCKLLPSKTGRPDSIRYWPRR